MITVRQLYEMAKLLHQPIGASVLDDKDNRVNLYKQYSTHPKISNVGSLSLHKKIDGNRITISTHDDKKKEVVHHSLILEKDKSASFPFKHHEQVEVARERDNPDIPKNHATDVIYNHVTNNNLSLKSSEQQYTQGPKMWCRLVDKALKDKHHVYHWDGTKLHKTTEENKKEHLEKSIGVDDSFANKHMIISKNKLD